MSVWLFEDLDIKDPKVDEDIDDLGARCRAAFQYK